MQATVNGVSIVDLRLSIPRKGVWQGELSAESDVPLDFSLKLDIAGIPFSATARRSSVTEGTAVAEFVGGVAGLGKPIEARSYNNVPLSIPLQAILDASGEMLARNSFRDVLQLNLNAWSIRQGRAGAALNTLIEVGAASVQDSLWRILPSGELFVGVEGWEEVEIDFEPLSVDPKADHLRAYMESPGLLPGTTWLGRKVSHVEHTLKGDKLRTEVWFE